jgi:hypothetical protein
MFFKSLIKTLQSSTYNAFYDSNFDKVNPNIVKYFRNEYGTNWKVALEHHIYKESLKNDKKAA